MLAHLVCLVTGLNESFISIHPLSVHSYLVCLNVSLNVMCVQIDNMLMLKWVTLFFHGDSSYFYPGNKGFPWFGFP